MFSTPNPLKAHLVSGRSVFRHQAVTLNRRCASHQTSLITITKITIAIITNNITSKPDFLIIIAITIAITNNITIRMSVSIVIAPRTRLRRSPWPLPLPSPSTLQSPSPSTSSLPTSLLPSPIPTPSITPWCCDRHPRLYLRSFEEKMNMFENI